ncbi:MAG TPA: uroporphyrinogen decarboxylase family protein [Methanomassiliicoccales archaeon]|nr:uroporphyrinogen decarboxylase family protein [Methanomassiliicoccales archaeon]
MNKMTSRERFEATLAHEPVDRACILEMDEALLMARYIGLQVKDLRWSPEVAAKATAELQKFTKFDIIVSATENMGILKDLGQTTSEPDNNTASPTSLFYATPEDVDSKEFFDPMDPKQTPWMNKGTFDKVGPSRELVGDNVIMTGLVPGVMSMSAFLMGAEPLMLNIITEPEMAKKVISNVEKLCEGILSRYVEAGIELPLIGDPVASEDLISEQLFRDFAMGPTMRNFVHLKSAYKTPILYHVCGDTQNVCKLTPEMGVDIFSVDSKIDLAHYKRTIGDRVVVAGAVPTITALLNGTKETVRESVRSCTEKAAHGGGFVLAPACGFPRDTPWDNITMLRTAAEEYTPVYQ